MANSIPVLEVRDIEKIYKTGKNKVIALKKINFELYKGEVVIVMGSSGSGKSTLLNILGGLDSPSKGKIIMDGIEVKNYHKEPYATNYRREKIGFVFQSYNLLHALAVEENIALPLVLRGEKPSTVKEKTHNLIKLMGLYNWRTHRSIELSGGQQQRVALARALVTTPSILLADEPTGNLDSTTSAEILRLIIEIKDRMNQSIVIVTHDPRVAAYGDRVLFFHDGEIVNEYRGLSPMGIEDNYSEIMNILQGLARENLK